MFFNILSSVKNFFFHIPSDTWRDVILNSIIIPIVFEFYSQLRSIWLNSYPLSQLFYGYRNSDYEILVFLSQLSSFRIGLSNPSYFSNYPSPLPNNHNKLATKNFQNIDPLWSQSDGKCVSHILNIIGKINITLNYRIANTILDWRNHYNPIFTIGFNPKTVNLYNYCNPLYFDVSNGNSITIQGHSFVLDCNYPKDAGIIQKTIITETNSSVFIIAGLGTTGTEVAGYLLSSNAVDLGKLYGNKAFCLAFKTDMDMAEVNSVIKGVYPRPHWSKAIFYPVTYFKWKTKNVFPS
jgi:hypothetical protein